MSVIWGKEARKIKLGTHECVCVHVCVCVRIGDRTGKIGGGPIVKGVRGRMRTDMPCTTQVKKSTKYHISPVTFPEISLNAHTFSALVNTHKSCWWDCKLVPPL